MKKYSEAKVLGGWKNNHSLLCMPIEFSMKTDGRLGRQRFSFSYDIASSVMRNVRGLDNSYYTDRFLDDLKIEELVLPSEKSVLFSLARHVVSENFSFFTDFVSMDFDRDAVELDELKSILKDHRIPIPRWFSSDDVFDHIEDINEMLKPLIGIEAQSVFTLLFSDVQFLWDFHVLLSKHVRKFKKKEYPDHLRKDGVFIRKKNIPQWLKEAIWFRDQGFCQICGKDLQAKCRPRQGGEFHYDHIVPLGSHGTNDGSNFQLTCNRCNLRKGRRNQRPKIFQRPLWQVKREE